MSWCRRRTGVRPEARRSIWKRRKGWVRIRLDLTADFRLAGTEFDSADIRPELFFYNGKDREAGYPRREAEFEIADIRLEP